MARPPLTHSTSTLASCLLPLASCLFPVPCSLLPSILFHNLDPNPTNTSPKPP
ncbi:hypothetical protein [Moorena sp. SIO3H5]|uniref:hypothetical protein n=1 Tax=Moorena sp. SIO3H5 TaxID=2607834 RepID=UPI0013B953F4|nr:hypothetical protein [Moorena sp. SIO3H5]NEO72773.1 hypothetical protein [Moorena sp. SIO3H5]